MKKTETKYYCDFCHKECTDKHYKLTIPTVGQLAVNSSDQSILNSSEVDVCQNCAETVAFALGIISTCIQDSVEYNGTITREVTENKNCPLGLIDHVKVTIDCDLTKKKQDE